MSGQAKVAVAAAMIAMPQLAVAHHSTACDTSPRAQRPERTCHHQAGHGDRGRDGWERR